MLHPTLRTYALLLLLLALSLPMLGCDDDDDDNPVGADDDHLEAFGVRLIDDGGNVLVTVDGTGVTGSLALTTGSTIGPFELEFLNADGEWEEAHHEEGDDHDHDHGEEEHELEIELEATGVVSVLLGEDDPAVDEHMAFSVIAEAVGSTNLRVVILHEGHEDYVSAWIPVQVSAP